MAESYEGWAIVELMGHRRLGGRVSQVEQYGVPMLRIDIPGEKEGDDVATQFYGGGSIYCLTPTTEAMARAVALKNQPSPVQRWELPALPATVVDDSVCEGDYDDDREMGLE